jgi:hypothetical protein
MRTGLGGPRKAEARATSSLPVRHGFSLTRGADDRQCGRCPGRRKTLGC